MSVCAVCGGPGVVVDRCKVLNRHEADLWSCTNCGFLFFKRPHWLQEAYSDAIADTDTGILLRNRRATTKVSSMLLTCMDGAVGRRFLDCAGGYGLFVRGMRDAGFDFRWSDPYCKNLLAKGFEHHAGDGPYGAVTAFEVFEHVEDPIGFARSLFEQARGAETLIFTTNVFEGAPPPRDWWYYSFATGQHISFYQPRTLKFIAGRLGMRFVSRNGFHVFTRNDGFSDLRLRLAVSPLAPWIVRGLGRGLVGKSVSDHHAITQGL